MIFVLVYTMRSMWSCEPNKIQATPLNIILAMFFPEVYTSPKSTTQRLEEGYLTTKNQQM
jgi:hypothetical protein